MLLLAAKWLHSCLTLCDPTDCSPPGSSARGILQARILEWIAMPSPEDLPDPGIKRESPALQAVALPLPAEALPQIKALPLFEPPGKLSIYT